MADNVQVLVSGERLLGYGCRSVDAVIREEIDRAESSIHVAAYLITSMAYIKSIVDAAKRGTAVYMVVNSLDEQPSDVRESLAQARKLYSHFVVKNFCASHAILHAKVMVFDRSRAIVGSANFSEAAFTYNHEIAVMVEGSKAGLIASQIEGLVVD